MIDKFVTHLKNIIFFKTVIYIILIITLFTLIPILTEDLERESFKRQKSQTFLQTAQIKLESIVHFEKKISAINKKYQQLIKSSFGSGCFNRITLIKNIESLSKKYHLFEPIDCKIFRVFKNDSLSKTNGNIKVHYY